MSAPAPHDIGNDIARALRGRRISPSAWTAPCPFRDRHPRRKGSGAPSLRIAIAGKGLDVSCACGCDAADLRIWLSRRGFLDGDGPVEHVADPEALALWNDAKPIADTHGDQYFKAIGITGSLPPSLRYRPPGRVRLPQVLAAVQAPDRRVIAVQSIFLERDAPRLADIPRLTFGTLGRGAFRAAAASPQVRVVETVEDAVRLTEAGTPAWAALAGWRIDRVEVPHFEARRAA